MRLWRNASSVCVRASPGLEVWHYHWEAVPDMMPKLQYPEHRIISTTESVLELFKASQLTMYRSIQWSKSQDRISLISSTIFLAWSTNKRPQDYICTIEKRIYCTLPGQRLKGWVEFKMYDDFRVLNSLCYDRVLGPHIKKNILPR